MRPVINETTKKNGDKNQIITNSGQFLLETINNQIKTAPYETYTNNEPLFH